MRKLNIDLKKVEEAAVATGSKHGIAEALGVSVKTVHRWCESTEEIADVIRRGFKAFTDARIGEAIDDDVPMPAPERDLAAEAELKREMVDMIDASPRGLREIAKLLKLERPEAYRLLGELVADRAISRDNSGDEIVYRRSLSAAPAVPLTFDEIRIGVLAAIDAGHCTFRQIREFNNAPKDLNLAPYLLKMEEAEDIIYLHNAAGLGGYFRFDRRPVVEAGGGAVFYSDGEKTIAEFDGDPPIRTRAAVKKDRSELTPESLFAAASTLPLQSDVALHFGLTGGGLHFKIKQNPALRDANVRGREEYVRKAVQDVAARMPLEDLRQCALAGMSRADIARKYDVSSSILKTLFERDPERRKVFESAIAEYRSRANQKRLANEAAPPVVELQSVSLVEDTSAGYVVPIVEPEAHEVEELAIATEPVEAKTDAVVEESNPPILQLALDVAAEMHEVGADENEAEAESGRRFLCDPSKLSKFVSQSLGRRFEEIAQTFGGALGDSFSPEQIAAIGAEADAVLAESVDPSKNIEHLAAFATPVDPAATGPRFGFCESCTLPIDEMPVRTIYGNVCGMACYEMLVAKNRTEVRTGRDDEWMVDRILGCEVKPQIVAVKTTVEESAANDSLERSDARSVDVSTFSFASGGKLAVSIGEPREITVHSPDAPAAEDLAELPEPNIRTINLGRAGSVNIAFDFDPFEADDETFEFVYKLSRLVREHRGVNR